MAKARHSRFDCTPGCSVEAAIGLIDGKWKSIILWHLLSGTLRFNEIRRHVDNCTPRMLTNQLREMEDDGLITRKVYAQVPPKVEYSLSDLGRTSAGARCSPSCKSSSEMLSGVRTKAMWPSRGGRLMVTPAAIRRAQVA